MTEYIVGKDADFNTLTAAAKAAKPGDVVRVLPGVYREMLRCSTPGVTWIGEPGAILDGGWNGKTKESGFSGIVSIPAADVVIDGLTMINAKSRGLSIGKGGDRAIVRNCRIDNTYHGGIAVNGGDVKGVSGLLIENNVLTRMGQERLVTGGGRVAGSFNLIRCMDSIIRDNVVGGGLGEGINSGKGSYRLLVEGNIIFATEHVGLYFNRCVDCTGRGNFIFAVNGKSPLKTGSGDLPAGIIIGDERNSTANFPWSSGNTIENNLVVGYGKLFQVRNNSKEKAGYDTQLVNTTIRRNTFVAGPQTTGGISIKENQRGRPHKGSVFQDNIIYAPGVKPIGDMSGGGIQFANNLWSDQPPPTMRGEGDYYGNALLVNPGAIVNGTWSSPETDFDLNNYRPRPNSPAVRGGVAVFGALGVAGGEPPVDPPDEPEPPDEPQYWIAISLVDFEEIRAAVDKAHAMLENMAADTGEEYDE
jgi:hypothetical protein